LLDTDLKIILLDYRNNVETLKIMKNAVKGLDIPAISLIVQQNYFSDLYLAKILEHSCVNNETYHLLLRFRRILDNIIPRK